MSKWTYRGAPLEEIPPKVVGFTYLIKHPASGVYYYGSKKVQFKRTKKLSKKASEAAYSGRGRKPTKAVVYTESDWETYRSSSKELQKMIEEQGEDKFQFIVLDFWPSTQKLSLEETKLIICTGALEDPLSLNSWVSCRIRKSNL